MELSFKQQQIIDKINEKGRCLYSELKKINSSVDTLLKKGILKKIEVEEKKTEYFTLQNTLQTIFVEIQ